jgi:hypothetical protein
MLVGLTQSPNISPVGYVVTIQDSGFSIRVYSDIRELVGRCTDHTLQVGDTDAFIGPVTTFSLDDIHAKGEVSDYSCVIFPLDKGMIGEPFNRYADTSLSKRSGHEEYRKGALHSAIHLYVPHKHAQLDACAMHIWTHPAYPLLIDRPVVEQAVEATRQSVLPALSMTGPERLTPDGYATVTVNASVSDARGTLYLEGVNGYLPKRRIQMSGGTASFRIGALGLEPGDEVRVKVGFKYFTGLDDITIPVMA